MSAEFNTPFSQEELNSFVQVEAPPEPEAQEPKQVYVTPEEAEKISSQHSANLARELQYLREQVTQKQPEKTVEPEKPKAAPVRFDESGNAIIQQGDLDPILERAIEAKLSKYHKENIEPYQPTVVQMQQQQSVNQSVEVLKKIAPDILEGRDASQIGKMAIDLYNSGFNTGFDDASKTQYAIDTIRQMLPKGSATTSSLPVSTGAGQQNPYANTVPAYNQTGRTESGSGPNNPFGWAKGASIKLPTKTINELGGLAEYQDYAAYVNSVYEYNKQHNMGWKIETE